MALFRCGSGNNNYGGACLERFVMDPNFNSSGSKTITFEACKKGDIVINICANSIDISSTSNLTLLNSYSQRQITNSGGNASQKIYVYKVTSDGNVSSKSTTGYYSFSSLLFKGVSSIKSAEMGLFYTSSGTISPPNVSSGDVILLIKSATLSSYSNAVILEKELVSKFSEHTNGKPGLILFKATSTQPSISITNGGYADNGYIALG